MEAEVQTNNKQTIKQGFVGSWHGTGQRTARPRARHGVKRAAAEQESSSSALQPLPGPGHIILGRGRPGGGVGVVELCEKVVFHFTWDALFLSDFDFDDVVVVVVGAAAILPRTNKRKAKGT
jgi:hypothetical protein